MSKGGGSTQVTSTSVDPQIKEAYLGNLNYATKIANQLPAQQFAGFTPTYQAGEQAITAAAQGGLGTQNLNTAADLTAALGAYSPQAMQATQMSPTALTGATGYAPSTATAAQMNMANIGQYMNPYTQQVVDTTMADMERARQQAIGNINQQATAARAFGGSRQAVAQDLTNQQYGQQLASTLANLRSQGYTQAANIMAQDVASRQQAALANQAALNTAGQFGASAANQAAMQNAAAINAQNQYQAQLAQQAALANQAAGLSGAQFRLGAAQQLGALGGAQQAGQYQAGQALMGLGSAQQQLAQQQLDATRNLPLQQLQTIQSALGLNPANLGMTQTSPLYQNTGASALGGALGGAYLGNMIPSLGAGYGAGLGALLALL